MTHVIVQALSTHALNDCRMPGSSTLAPPVNLDLLSIDDCRGAYHDCRSPQPLPPIQSATLTSLRPHPLLQMLPLDAEHAVVFVPSLSQVAVLDLAARKLLEQLPLRDLPSDDGVLHALQTMQRAGLVTTGDGTIPRPPEPDVLVAWLHITNACNLRCSYCYLHKTGESMDEATGRAAIDAVVRSARAYGYRGIALKYAGGEASLRIRLVEAMHTYALKQAERHGLTCQAGLLSNGAGLTCHKLDVIRRLNLQLMISLDGMAEVHDRQRPMISGRGSFTAVLHGIEEAVDAGVVPNISVTVTGQSVAGLPELIAWLLDRELPFTISFYRENDCSSSYVQLQLDEQRIIDGMRAAYQIIERNPPRWNLLGSLLDRVDLSVPHRRTCAVGENYLVIDHHGRIAKCQMTMNDPVTTIVARNPLALIRADQIGVQNIPVDQKEGCRLCEWRYWCASGCTIATYRATGRYDVRSPNCGIYKALYPDVLRLEGYRLLHWHRRAQSIAG